MINKKIYLTLAALLFTSISHAGEYQVTMGSHQGASGQDPIAYQFRVDDENGTPGPWITVPPNQTIFKKYESHNISKIEIFIPGDALNGILSMCHQYLHDNRLQPDYSQELGDFWDTRTSIHSTFPATGQNFSFTLFGFGMHFCPAYATDCQISDCILNSI
ncbi:MAG: hypothetical protein ACD_60C00093G0001 [uncultured bacterium]|nr:MAG: hypothetical protein ACD_60C00093G0001 [uncultured bacterium]